VKYHPIEFHRQRVGNYWENELSGGKLWSSKTKKIVGLYADVYIHVQYLGF